MLVDNLDLEILKLMQNNGRITISDISKEINLSIPAVVRRIEKMETLKVIRGYRTLIDGDKSGMKVHGYILGRVYKVMLSRFYQYINSVPEIVKCETIISGGKEVILEFYFKDLDQLMSFYESDIRKYMDSMEVYLIKGVPGKDNGIPFEIK